MFGLMIQQDGATADPSQHAMGILSEMFPGHLTL